MDQQNGLFGFLENHVMGPMGKLAQFKVVRAIRLQVWLLYHLLL
ncbi:PTS system transporter subunit IIC [Streptococcus pneumoniae]|nr:PTS system transporter subunit IIC [Streptococcus pneumoniae]